MVAMCEHQSIVLIKNNTSLVLSATDDLLQGMTDDTKTTLYIT